MKLGNLTMVNRNVAERDRLLGQISMGEVGVTVLVGSEIWSDDALTALVRPVVLGELRGRLRQIEADLVGMGVELA